MNIYEFITPSDAITFKTDCDKVAFTCALLLGNGKAGCKRIDKDNNEVRIPTMLLFSANPDSDIKEFLGIEMNEFINKNKPKIKECFSSFSYGNIEDRITYDDTVSAITDDVKLKEFKAKHEDRNRTSMSEWVSYAWDLSDKI